MFNNDRVNEEVNSLKWVSSNPYDVFSKAEKRERHLKSIDVTNQSGSHNLKNQLTQNSEEVGQKQYSQFGALKQRELNNKPYLLSLKIQQLNTKQVLKSNDQERINEILRRLSKEKELTQDTINLIQEAYKDGHIQNIQNLFEFAKNSKHPIEESYSQKYIGLQNGKLGIQSSRLPMQKKMTRSSSLSQIEYQIKYNSKGDLPSLYVRGSPEKIKLKQIEDIQNSISPIPIQNKPQSRFIPNQLPLSQLNQNFSQETTDNRPSSRLTYQRSFSRSNLNSERKKRELENENIKFENAFINSKASINQTAQKSNRSSRNTLNKDLQILNEVDSYNDVLMSGFYNQQQSQIDSQPKIDSNYYSQEKLKKDQIYTERNRLINSYSIPKLLVAQKKQQILSESEIESNIMNQKKSQKKLIQVKDQEQKVNKNEKLSEEISQQNRQRLRERIAELDKQKKKYDEISFKIMESMPESNYYYTDQLLTGMRGSQISISTDSNRNLNLKYNSSYKKVNASTSFN
eukprot:403331377